MKKKKKFQINLNIYPSPSIPPHTIRNQRQAVLDHAYTLEPHRFHRRPIAPQVPDIAWINPPQPDLSHNP